MSISAVLAACVVKLGLAPTQANGALIAFFLPAWLGVAAALAWLRSKSTR